MTNFDSPAELLHYGRKGMKWYQHIFGDKGSTSGNKGKSGKTDDEEKSGSSKSSSSSGKRPMHNMSNEELQNAIDRLNLEKRYKELMQSVNPPPSRRGKKFVTDVLEKSGKNIGEQLVTYAMGTMINKSAGKEIVNPKKGQKDKK